MPKTTSVLIHYTHKETLGHTTRVLSLCHELARNHAASADVHLMQGGLPQTFIRFPASTHTLNIPYPFDSRASFSGAQAPRKTDERSRFVLNAARRINPDVFITEFFPFGRLEYLPELLPTLRHLRAARGKAVRIYASIGYPYLMNLREQKNKKLDDMIQAVIGLYDKILIHTPRELENPFFRASLASEQIRERYDQFFKMIASKSVYTGYTLPNQERSPSSQKLLNTSGHTFNVIISRGGGAVYPKIIAHAIQAQALLGKRYRLIIAAGPSTSSAERRLFEACMKKADPDQVTLFDHIPDLGHLIAACHASVSMCGYNTSVQLLSCGTPSIIIPYLNERSKGPANDQLARAQLLQQQLGSTILTYASMSPTALAAAIRDKCEPLKPKNPAPRNWFHGARSTAKIILRGTGN